MVGVGLTGRMHPASIMHTLLRSLTAAVLVLASTATLAGCFLVERSAPAETTSSADALDTAAEEIPGVDSAEVNVFQSDPIGHQNEWTISLRVVAADAGGLDDLPAPLSELLREHRGSATVDFSLRVPGADGLAPSLLSDLSSDSVARVAGLRAVPGVVSVDAVTWSGYSVDVADDVTLGEIMPTLRPFLTSEPGATIFAGWRHGDQTNELFVSIAASWPSDTFADSLDALRTMPAVTSVSAMIISDTTSISVDVETDRPDAPLAFLAAIPPAEALSATTDTIRYSVSGPGDAYVSGVIGNSTQTDVEDR